MALSENASLTLRQKPLCTEDCCRYSRDDGRTGHHGVRGLLILLLSSTLAAQVSALQSYTNIYGQLSCYAEAVVQPESTEQLAAAVKQFAQAAKTSGKQLKIRTTRSIFHSPASFPCPHTSSLTPSAADTSSAAPSTVAVLTQDFKQILSVDKTAYTVRVQAGLQVFGLLRWAEENGMSTELGAPTTYAELTIGGVISANGHGTGSNVTSSMGGIALEFTWIDAAGNIHVSQRHSEEGRGLAGGVGLFGIITEVKLQLTPLSNTKAVSINLQHSSRSLGLPQGGLMLDGAETQPLETPNVALVWRPDLNKYNAYLMSEIDEKPTKDGAQNGLIFPLPTMVANMFQLVLLPMQVDTQDTAVSAALDPVNCLITLTTLAYLKWGSKEILPRIPGAPLDVALPQMKAVGTTNQMMAGGCEPYCTWNSDIVFDDVEVAIELEDFPARGEDIKKIIQQDLHLGGQASKKCMPFGAYFFIRFGKGDNDFSSVTSGMNSPVYVYLTHTKSRTVSEAPAKYEYVTDAFEQLTLCKYKGRPHWGKNYDRTFTHPNCSLRNNLPDFDKQLQLQAKYDPSKTFEPPLMTRIIDRSANIYSPKCDLRRTCYCQEDSHCADDFVCVPGLAFSEYKLCKPAALKARSG